MFKIVESQCYKESDITAIYMAEWQYPDNSTPGCPTRSSTQEDETQDPTILNSCRFTQQQQVEGKKWAQRENLNPLSRLHSGGNLLCVPVRDGTMRTTAP